MSTRRIVAATGLAATLAYEGAVSMGRFDRRKKKFEAATKRSVATGRQLVVVGDPNAGLHTRLVQAYDCGAVCVDLNGCPACPKSIAADITKGIEGLEDDSSVVYVSCVLEYVEAIEPAMSELKRIAGSDDNLFLVFVDPWSLTAFLYPWGKRRAADEEGRTWHNVTWGQRLLGAGALLALTAAMLAKD
ncbi:MAG: hypothetical protein ACPG4T_22650 [Nannocystaceae bacterium]